MNNCPTCGQPVPGPESWPDWDLFVTLIKEGPPRKAVRCLLLNAVARFRVDYPQMTVENAIGWGSLNSYRKVGKATMRLALDIIKTWRERTG